MTLPRKNQIVTVRRYETEHSRGTATGTVVKVSRVHEEFALVVDGELQWFGAEWLVAS